MYKVVDPLPYGIDGSNPKLSQYLEIAWELKVDDKEEKSEWKPHRLHIFSKKPWTAGKTGKAMQKTKRNI